MRTGTARVYVYSADQIADAIITRAKLDPLLVDRKVRAYRATTDQAIPATTFTKVQLNAETFDVGADFDPVTNYRFTVPAGAAGYYLIAANISVYGNAAAGWALAAIFKNGTAVATGTQNYPAAAPIGSVHVEDYLALVAGDYIEIWIYMDTAGQVALGSVSTWADFLRIF